jgi:hypothetical protein
MSAYLFIADPQPRREAGYDTAPADVQNHPRVRWRCHSRMQAGDHVLVFVTGEGIDYGWEALTNPRRDGPRHFWCDVRYLGTVAPSITFEELLRDVGTQAWPLLRAGFRGHHAVRLHGGILARICHLRPHIEWLRPLA